MLKTLFFVLTFAKCLTFHIANTKSFPAKDAEQLLNARQILIPNVSAAWCNSASMKYNIYLNCMMAACVQNVFLNCSKNTEKILGCNNKPLAKAKRQ